MEQFIKHTCPVCLSSDIKKSFECEDYMVTKEKFNIDQCESCGFLFTNPVPNIQEIGKYYESEEYVSHSDTKSGVKNFIYHVVRSFTLSRKIGLLKRYHRSGKLLDIGSGAGYFLSKSQKAGYYAKGLEPSQSVREKSIKDFNIDVDDISELYNLSENSVDVITMWHVLEHVYNLNEDIEQMLKVLKEDGTLIVAVPNPSSWDAKYYGLHWGGWDVPRHLYHFREEDIHNLFSRFDCSIKEIKPMQFDPVYVSMLSESYRGGSLFSAVYYGMKSYFNKNKFGCTSQIYILKKNPK